MSAGGTVVYPSEDKMSDPSYWIGLLIRHDITIWNFVPENMKMVTDYLKDDNAGYKIDLREIFMSGNFIPLSDKLEECPVGVKGNLCIGGRTC